MCLDLILKKVRNLERKAVINVSFSRLVLTISDYFRKVCFTLTNIIHNFGNIRNRKLTDSQNDNYMHKKIENQDLLINKLLFKNDKYILLYYF